MGQDDWRRGPGQLTLSSSEVREQALAEIRLAIAEAKAKWANAKA